MIECPRCYTKVPMDGGRPRPWCPQCGCEIKAAATSREPALAGQGNPSGAPLDTATVQRMVDEVVGVSGANGPPVSRAYEHKSCKAVTVASGDDLVRLECAFRPLDETYCCRCQTFVGLDEVRWADTGETISAYRRRLKKSVGFWRSLYLTIFCNAYQGAINLHLDKRGRPLARTQSE
jgi:hypothetical protein